MEGSIEPYKKKSKKEKLSYNDSCKDQYKITINWIRHGESCANHATGGIKDKIDPNLGLGYGINNNTYETDLIQEASEWLNVPIDDPIDDHEEYDEHDIAIAKTILERTDIIPDTANLSDYVTSFWSPVNNTLNKKTDDKSTLSSTYSYIINKFKYEPNLTYIGMNHSINLGTDFFSQPHRNNSKNIYISSGLTRTITTALLALRFIPNAVIYVVPYINEIHNGWDNIVGDKQNKAVESSILIKKIMFIKDWLERNWITRFDDIEIINFLIAIYEIINEEITVVPGIEKPRTIKEKIKNVLDCRKNIKCRNENIGNVQNLVLEIVNNKYIKKGIYFRWGKNNDIKDETKYKFVMNTIKKVKKLLEDRKNIRGPIVNFEIYNYFEHLYSIGTKDIPDTKYSNSDFFLSNVLKVIHNDIIFNEENRTYPQNLKRSNQVNTDDITIYAFIHGSLIRKMWKENKSDTYAINEDELEDMMNTTIISNTITFGQLHRIIDHDFEIIHRPTKIRSSYYNFEHYNTNVCKLQSIKGIINYPLGEPLTDLDRIKYVPTQDVEFFYGNEKKYNNLPLQIGGYKQKYLKYKKKYLNLKNT